MKKVKILLLLISLAIISTATFAQRSSLNLNGGKRGDLLRFEETQKMDYQTSSNKTVNRAFTTTSEMWEPDYTKRIGIADFNNVEVDFGGIVKDSEGNIIYTCTNGRQEFGYKSQIVKVDQDGNQLWSNDYSEFSYSTGEDIIIDSENNIYVLGNVSRDDVNDEIFIVKYDQQGVLQWEQFYSQEYFSQCFSKELFLDGEGYLWLVAEITSGLNGKSFYVSRLDNSGNEQWNYSIEISNPDAYIVYVKSFTDSNNRLFVNMNVDNQYNSFILNNAGELVSEDVQNYNCLDIEYHENNYFTLAQNQDPKYMIFNKTDEAGNQIWMDTLHTNNTVYFGDIYINSNGKIYSVFTDGWAGPTTVIINSEGTIVYDEVATFQGFNSSSWFNIFANSNDEFYIAGYGNLSLDGTDKAAVVSFDNTGGFNSLTLIAPDETFTQTRAYDFAFYDEKVIVCGIQGDYLVEPGWDLFVTEMLPDYSLSWTNVTQKENTSNLSAWGADMDEDGNTFYAVNSNGKYKVVKQNPQGEIEWISEYNGTGCADVKIMSDNYIVAAGFDQVNYIFSGVLAKINQEGTTLWEVEVGEEGLLNVIVQFLREDNDGNIIVASVVVTSDYATRVMISKINSNGESIWNYINMNSSLNGSQVHHLTVAPNNDIVFSGSETDPNWAYDMYAERISTGGELIWEYHGNIGDNDLFSQAVSDNNGNTYLVGETGMTGFIYKLNETGELVWEETMETVYGYYHSVFINPNDYDVVYCSGAMVDPVEYKLKPVITSMTALGDVNWQTVAEADYDSRATFLIGDDEYLYQTANVYNPYTESHSIILSMYDYDGVLDTLSSQQICRGVNDNLKIMDLYQTTDRVGVLAQVNGFYRQSMVGLSSLFSKPYIVINSIEDLSRSAFEIYPNPVIDKVNIKNAKSINRVEVLSVNGSKLFEFTNHNKTELFSINTSKLKAGIFFLKIHTEGEKPSISKFIKQ